MVGEEHNVAAYYAERGAHGVADKAALNERIREARKDIYNVRR